MQAGTDVRKMEALVEHPACLLLGASGVPPYDGSVGRTYFERLFPWVRLFKLYQGWR